MRERVVTRSVVPGFMACMAYDACCENWTIAMVEVQYRPTIPMRIETYNQQCREQPCIHASLSEWISATTALREVFGPTMGGSAHMSPSAKYRKRCISDSFAAIKALPLTTAAI